MKPSSILVALGLITSLITGQCLNVDVGNNLLNAPGSAVPAGNFGAASQHDGTWNAILGTGLGPYPMLDLWGNATGIVCTRSGGMGGLFGFDNPSTTGSFEALMDDGQNIGNPGAVVTYTFSGLAPGGYALFTYAWAPDYPTFQTNVFVPGSTSVNPQVVGGELIGTDVFSPGITHAIHNVEVYAGTDLVVVLSTASGMGTINGFQLVADMYRVTMSQAGPGGAFSLVNAAGTPGYPYLNLVSLQAGRFPNGWAWGIDIAIEDALTEIAFGVPFFGTLDATGGASFVVQPPLPTGLALFYVGVEVDPGFQNVIAVTHPDCFVIN